MGKETSFSYKIGRESDCVRWGHKGGREDIKAEILKEIENISWVSVGDENVSDYFRNEALIKRDELKQKIEKL